MQDVIDLAWANNAVIFARGEDYKGKTSPHWYTSTDFHELCLAAKNMTVQDLVSLFDGCSRKIKEITDGFKGRQATDLTASDAMILLPRMKAASKPVNPKRLGRIGEFDRFENSPQTTYSITTDNFKLTSKGEVVEIPYVVEAWVYKSKSDELGVCVNKTHITGFTVISREKNNLKILGCNLRCVFEKVGKENFTIWINIISPYVPITTDGKSPDLNTFSNGIDKAVGSAIKKAKKRNSAKSGQKDQKEVVLEHLDEAINKVSENYRYRYKPRQIFYVLRPMVFSELEKS